MPAERCIINPESIEETHIHVAVAVIWRAPGSRQFLIAQRQAGQHLAGYWEFPGGKIEPGETVRAALSREMVEEVGVEPIEVVPLLQVYYRYPQNNILLDTWCVDAYRGEVTAAERQALAWVEVGQIENYRFPPADAPILDAIRQRS